MKKNNKKQNTTATRVVEIKNASLQEYAFSNVEEFARLVEVHPQTVYYHINKGHIKMPLTLQQWNARPQKVGRKTKYIIKLFDTGKKA